MERYRVLIRPVVVGNAKLFVAQCLERNIAVQGHDPKLALSAFMEHVIQIRTLVASHGAEDPFKYLGEAPRDAWVAFDEAFKGQLKAFPINCGEIEIEPALAFAS